MLKMTRPTADIKITVKIFKETFLPDCQGSSKLEKAEILQMTVDHLKLLHAMGGKGEDYPFVCIKLFYDYNDNYIYFLKIVEKEKLKSEIRAVSKKLLN